MDEVDYRDTEEFHALRAENAELKAKLAARTVRDAKRYSMPKGEGGTQTYWSEELELELIHYQSYKTKADCIEAFANINKEMKQRIEELEAEVSDDQSALQNLMAVINGDGGHKADEFDTPKEAAEHCESVVVGLFTEVERLREALSRLAKLRAVGTGRCDAWTWDGLEPTGRDCECLACGIEAVVSFAKEALEPPNEA